MATFYAAAGPSEDDAPLIDAFADDGGDGDDGDGPAPGRSWSCSEWFIQQNVVVRWLLVLCVVGSLAGTLTALLLKFYQPPSPPPPDRVSPVVITTWFRNANEEAARRLSAGYTALDSVELGCAVCEDARCDGTVGWGGSEDDTGSVSLDALIMDGDTHDTGAVTFLRRTRHAIAAARKVMYYSQHTLLAGEGADAFAGAMGIAPEPLNSSDSDADYARWRNRSCAPNFYAHVTSAGGCAPYAPVPTATYTPAYAPSPAPASAARASAVMTAASAAAAASPAARLPRPPPTRGDHDTVAMCAIDASGRIAGGGSSNGRRYKVAGRASDIAMPGAGVYADREGGCAAATGDGDVTARFLPAFLAVEYMRLGLEPPAACERTVRRIMASQYVNWSIGLLCLDRFGRVGAAAHGWTADGTVFTYAVASGPNATTTIVAVPSLLP